LPATQLVHALAPAAEKKPEAQAKHVDSDSAFSAAENLPTAQGKQVS
jgi:hypothetical protein